MGKSGQISHQANQPQVLNQHRVDARAGHTAHDLFNARELAREDQGVERDVALDAAAMQKRHQLVERIERDVGGSGPGVKARVESEVNRIGSVLDRGARTIPIAGRSQ